MASFLTRLEKKLQRKGLPPDLALECAEYVIATQKLIKQRKSLAKSCSLIMCAVDVFTDAYNPGDYYLFKYNNNEIIIDIGEI